MNCGLSLQGNFGGRGGNWNNGTGHCVHMRGLPFRATEMDIADVSVVLFYYNPYFITGNNLPVY